MPLREYRVEVTPHAVSSMLEISDYIGGDLMNPVAAERFLAEMRAAIKAQLQTFPAKFPLLDVQPWNARGIRRFRVKNFCIYYRVDESVSKVVVIDVIYAGSNQLSWLQQRGDE